MRARYPMTERIAIGRCFSGTGHCPRRRLILAARLPSRIIERTIMDRILSTSLLVFALSVAGVRAEKLMLVAGGGNGADGSPAREAKLQGPFGIDSDQAGNF